jgi:ATP adenylyltransferase
MDRIWAPWRIKYLLGKAKKKCIFCDSSRKKSKSHVIFKTKYSMSMLNIFPYNNGHIMISPLRHIKELSQLKEVELIDLFKTLNKAKLLLDRVLKPHGYNIGINISKAAGAGIPGHLHIHIVPRWRGDTNFMPVIYGARVISQSLDELRKRLKDAQSKKD